jgi:hypothetical protein
MSATPDFPEPVFVGGVGRSGTHAMGRLVAAHPRYHLIRTEVRFHASPRGLPDLLAGKVDLDSFLERMRGYWWKRGWGQGQGLQRICDRETFDSALSDFERDFEPEPWEASRRLIRAILDQAAAADGKPAWVEVTGQAIERADTLLRMFPRARFINMVRDGRAVVAGTLRKVDMTDDPMKALDKWERMVRASDQAMRAAPRETLLTVHLDDLAARDREGAYRRVVDFLEIDDDTPMRAYFDKRISAERAHVEQWRDRMAPQDARRVDRRYRRLVRRLRREGIDWVPPPEDAGIRVGPLRLPTPRGTRPSAAR